MRELSKRKEDILPRLHNVLVVHSTRKYVKDQMFQSPALLLFICNSHSNLHSSTVRILCSSTRMFLQSTFKWKTIDASIRSNRIRAGAWWMLIALRRHNDKLPCKCQPMTSANWKCYWWRVCILSSDGCGWRQKMHVTLCISLESYPIPRMHLGFQEKQNKKISNIYSPPLSHIDEVNGSKLHLFIHTNEYTTMNLSIE